MVKETKMADQEYASYPDQPNEDKTPKSSLLFIDKSNPLYKQIYTMCQLINFILVCFIIYQFVVISYGMVGLILGLFI